ncbi:hypothetical protein BDQ12DRAFT_724276 [Crucibulum laeve]|uniref:F-box domain-containing protein n=1 Tax=Crucibulum laeve TaxID=68775 RepID=A0A5C3LWC7_9AGAR|nr:hypothetical protein BDQ12DRAFT_724276 [Crucibulum laeve]
MRKAFMRQRFPNIRTIILPSYADIILKACENVRTVITTGLFKDELFEVIKEDCPAVEDIGGQIDLQCVQYIPKVLPGLRSIRMNVTYIWVIRSLEPLKDLRSIELLITDSTKIHANSELDKCIEEAKILLRGRAGKKSLVLSFEDCTHYMRPPFSGPLSPWKKSISLDTD